MKSLSLTIRLSYPVVLLPTWMEIQLNGGFFAVVFLNSYPIK